MENIEEIKNQLSRAIDEIIQDKLTENKSDTKYKTSFEDLESYLEREVEDCKRLVTEFKEDSYKVSAIEMEGFMRGLNHAIFWMKQYNPANFEQDE